ncbi:hypothetical protein SMIR_03175 [Streptomyces mirabilis]|uniref:hypothetical protein n=1 Tax=Streptomyces mirabilis TaxID=68239 RepID=UPI001BB06187|nr:hypothetical protein [Streptomyces mirabilis]QUW78272.1 hypothetical protein SMIR_03175 [Streptomyces mirabilis]
MVTQDGWINLTTGTFSAGAPPVGAAACGDSRAFELAGLLCDVDPATGDVLGLVLVEYEYNPDGSLSSVRLVDPGTGNTYTLQGELSICPGGTGTPAADLDLTVLCDVQADGTAVAFLRDYRRDATTGLINGHTDYGLDGTPYAATGTVGVCAEPCSNANTLLLCDLPDDEPSTGVPVATDTPQQFIADIPNGDFIARPGGGATLWSAERSPSARTSRPTRASSLRSTGSSPPRCRRTHRAATPAPRTCRCPSWSRTSALVQAAPAQAASGSSTRTGRSSRPVPASSTPPSAYPRR